MHSQCVYVRMFVRMSACIQGVSGRHVIKSLGRGETFGKRGCHSNEPRCTPRMQQHWSMPVGMEADANRRIDTELAGYRASWGGHTEALSDNTPKGGCNWEKPWGVFETQTFATCRHPSNHTAINKHQHQCTNNKLTKARKKGGRERERGMYTETPGKLLS